jgi:hypothetical protein
MFGYSWRSDRDLAVGSNPEDIRKFLIKKRNSYRRSALMWKFSTRGLLVFSVMMASLAAVIPGLEFCGLQFFQNSSVLGIISASLSAMSTTILGTLKCEENFLFNRKQRHEVDQLIVDMAKLDVEPSVVLDDLKMIMEERGARE